MMIAHPSPLCYIGFIGKGVVIIGVPLPYFVYASYERRTS